MAVVLAMFLSTLVLAMGRPAAAVGDDECIDNPFGDRSIYLRGGFSSWGAIPEYELAYNCNRFELQLELTGTNSFKVADANWSGDADFGGGTGGSDLVPGEPLPLAIGGSNLTAEFSGTQRVVLDVSESSTTPTLTIYACPPPPLGDALLGAIGTFNDGEPAPEDYFLYSCDAYYLNLDAEGSHEFTIADPIDESTSFGAPAGETAVLTEGEPYELTRATEQDGVGDLSFEFTGEHTLRLAFDGSTDAPVLTVTEQTWTNPGIAIPVTDPVARSVDYDSRDEAHKAPFGATVAGTAVELALEAAPGVDSVTLVLEDRLLEGNQEVLEYLDATRIPMTRTAGTETDRWSVTHAFDEIGVYGYYFEVVIGDETFVFHNNATSIYWTLERGAGGVGQIAVPPEDDSSIRRYRHTVYSPDYTVPDYAPDIVYYYVFPERFRNGDPANDPTVGEDTYLGGPIELHENWLDAPYVPGSGDGSDEQFNNDFFGGDLAGLTEKLDYLIELGVNTLYVNPIFEAGSNHKYDTADYMNIDSAFGSTEDFVELTEQAEQRGLRVILDTSLNHTGSDSVYFDRYENFEGTGAFEGATIQPDSPYADWYTFNPEAENPDQQYEGWVGISTLPNLTESDSWKDFAYRNDDSVMKYWLDQGADGWRMDVTPWVSDEFWREWRDEIKAHDPEALTVAETWFDSSKYFLGDTFDSTMNYIFRNAIVDFAGGSDAGEAYENIEHMREAYPPQAFYALMNLLSTHDAARVVYQFGYTGESTPSAQETEAKARLRLAVLFQMTFPGSPTVYYGDEVGVTGGEDPRNRATYPWEDEGGDPDEALLEDFQELIALRNETDVLRRGSISAPLYTDDNMIVLSREYEGVHAITAYNNDTERQEVTVDLPDGWEGTAFTDALTGESVVADGGTLTLTVPALFGSVLITADEVPVVPPVTPPVTPPAPPATPVPQTPHFTG